MNGERWYTVPSISWAADRVNTNGLPEPLMELKYQILRESQNSQKTEEGGQASMSSRNFVVIR